MTLLQRILDDDNLSKMAENNDFNLDAHRLMYAIKPPFFKRNKQFSLFFRLQSVYFNTSLKVMAIPNNLDPAWLHLTAVSMGNLQQGFGASHQPCLQLWRIDGPCVKSLCTFSPCNLSRFSSFFSWQCMACPHKTKLYVRSN